MEADPEGAIPHSNVLYLLNVKTSRKLMTLNCSDRGTLENIMRDPRINMGQEEKLRSYRVPHDNKDPWGDKSDDEHGLWVGPDPGLMNSTEV